MKEGRLIRGEEKRCVDWPLRWTCWGYSLILFGAKLQPTMP